VSKRSATIAYWVFALVVASVFAFLTFGYTTQMPIIKDAAQNTRGAYHLVHEGVISFDKQASGTPVPQMRREPLPIVVTGAFLLLHPAFSQTYTIPELLDGRLTEAIKGVNAFWRFLAAIFVFLLCLELFPDRRVAAAMAVICIAVSEFFFFSRPGIVDRMYTELPEVALMLLASWSAVRYVRSKTKTRALLLGAALGLLALTKASFLYIGIGFVFLLLTVEIVERFRTHRGEHFWRMLLSTYALVTVAMLVTIAPWIVRNYVEFRSPQITAGTEGAVLGIRMLVVEQPLLGAIYFFSPAFMKTRIVGPLTGYTQQDLLPGGRLERLAAVKQDKWDILKRRMIEKDYRGPQNEWIKHAALDAAIENPLRYLASIAVFAYKGAWFMDRAGAQPNLLALLCFFGVFFTALFTRDQILLAAFGLPAGLFFFIAIFTHALTRYTSPMTPFVILSMLWLADALVRLAYRRVALFRDLVDRYAGAFQPASGSSESRPTVPTSRAETASRS
jgi:hypothetical protein